MKTFGWLVLVAVTVPAYLLAQISGQVKDFKSGQFLKNAEVFIDNTLVHVTTDDKGYFMLEGLQPGIYRVGCAAHGRETTYQTVRLEKQEKYLLFLLKKDAGKKLTDKSLTAEVLKAIVSQNNIIPGWNERFITKTAQFKYIDEENGRRIYGKFEADNLALGYQVTGHVISYTKEQLLYLLQFYQMKGTEEEQKLWEKNRFITYQYGVNHFLESILQNTYHLNGYKITDEHGNAVSPENFLTTGFSGQTNSLNLKGKLNVTMGTIEEGYESWIEADGRIVFSDVGQILNSDSVRIGGVFNEKSLSFQLPNEYTPSVEKKIFLLEPYFEKAYLHLDKPYYLPGDTIWFKAYMNYNHLSLIESLSTVLHVELIEQHEGGRILFEKKLKIDDGEAWGEFVIPQSYSSDYLAIRAYTNWQRNYGDDQFFLKYLPIIKRSSNHIGERSELQTNNLVQLKFDKRQYKPRERISFSIRVNNELNQQVSAWMSVSVTDMSMVRLLNDSVVIVKTHTIKPPPATTRINYPLERGLTVSGQFFNEAGKPTMVSLTMMGDQLKQVFKFDTDPYGKFSMAGLEFYDSMPVRYSATLGKKLLYTGKLVFDQRNAAPLKLSWPAPVRNLERADFKIDKNTTLLNEVIIQAKRIAEEKREVNKPIIFRPFGEPDYIMEGSQLNYGAVNVIEMMRGKIPGLIINLNGIDYEIRFARAASFGQALSPLILIDDQPVGGSAQMALLSINPADVAAIEVTTRLNSLYGSTGANGVIAVYTKGGGLRGTFEEYESVKRIKLNGFATPAKFYGVNHKAYFIPPNSDFRTTLYWNPSVISSTRTGSDLVSFFASDSPGPYLITIEGVTAEGKPFRAEQLLEIAPD
ncbi:MAG: carboxypeptidase regulatory-like domain-containing protein [Flammeovirgaceae bacterium]|nr:MAG: carboxypeptidase regulatory-like domain-containing protein [Flammeovirgaceae bacterium]